MSTTDDKPEGNTFPQIRLNSAQLRTVAHPLRSRLLQRLQRHSPATATELAAELKTNTGATSYHLRRLAEVGLVVEADTPKRGRERWWRAAYDSYGWTESEVADGDPDTLEAVDWMLGHNLRMFVQAAEASLAARKQWPQRWRDAMPTTEFELELTPSEVTALTRELMDVLHRYEQLPADRELPEGEDRQTVLYFTHGLPQVRSES